MDDGPIPQWAGYLSVVIAALSFGSNFVPVKWYSKQIGDGLFFQWIFCSAVWIAGFIVFTTRGFPKFEPWAMLGGFLWCSGNVMTVAIIKCIGLSLGMLFWGLANMLMGWFSGTFGLFGLKPEVVHIPWLNYTGAALAALSGVVFAFIKPSTEDIIPDSKIVNEESYQNDSSRLLNRNEKSKSKFDIANIKPLHRQILGTGMAILAGILYGTNFDPPQYLIDNCETCSKVGLDYVFPHFCGIYVSSTLFFLIYCIVKKNKPIVAPEVAYPAFLSGIMWALADICWFIANSSLALVVSFPIIAVMPGVVASMWGILVFHEIRGKRNICIFGLGFVISLISTTCTVVSQLG